MTHRTRPPRRKLRAIIAAASATFLLIAGAALPSIVEPTAASWTDGEWASGAFEAATIPAPELTADCEYRSRILTSEVRIYWQPPEGYALEDVVIEASTSGLGSALAPLTGFNLDGNTELNRDGTYTTEVPTNLLGALLGLASELEIAFFVEHESGWRSEPASVASNAGLAAGLLGNCRNLT